MSTEDATPGDGWITLPLAERVAFRRQYLIDRLKPELHYNSWYLQDCDPLKAQQVLDEWIDHLLWCAHRTDAGAPCSCGLWEHYERPQS